MNEGVQIDEILSALRRQFEGRLAEKLSESSLFVDLADIYEIAQWYMLKIESLVVARRRLTDNQIETFLVDLDIQLFDHLRTHLRPLRRHLNVLLNDFAKNDENKGIQRQNKNKQLLRNAKSKKTQKR